MRKFVFFLTALGILGLASPHVSALDPVAPRSFRKVGMLWVKTPNPSQDRVEITKINSGEKRSVTPDQIELVPVGRYEIDVTMQDYHYRQQILVEPTERADVVVPGYGNIKVNSPFKAEVSVYGSGSENLVAKFPVNSVKTLPRGHYDVKISFGNKTSVKKDNIWVVTNTTRVLDVVEPN